MLCGKSIGVGMDSMRVEWCAIFVPQCAKESGQLNITIPKFSLVSNGVNWYKEKTSGKIKHTFQRRVISFSLIGIKQQS